ncbi:hypothetical protein FKW77_010574 [Venturia effusa]|uniref:Amidoligase enzyme n=1 Tax=Venturia effusa TaxID=50376 RepID=A0A517KXV5_9PEZI|nr:hypothetical protein FKW77_010574 [Venturia effusa]
MATPTSSDSRDSPSSSSMSSAAALTFGVEVEGIFAFHMDKLGLHLNFELPHAKIIRNLNDAQRKGLRQAKYPNQVYQSWALANAGGNPTTAEATMEHENGPIRAYKDEPLHIAKDLLSTTEQGKDVRLFNPEDHAKPERYTNWILTADQSLEALKDSEKVSAYPSRITDNDKGEWDTYGIELVSPPYLEDELSNAEADISSLLFALDTPTSAITTNTTCGLHVHIGLPSGESIPLKVLQHLSELLVIYEDQITRLHPIHRRGRKDEIESNKGRFAAESFANEPLDYMEGMIRDWDTDELVMRKLESRYKAVHEVHRLIFDEVEQAEDPIARLQKCMGPTRGMTVNFAYLNRANGPQTIEFRQHAGSTDVKEIGHWVRFCLALVKLAWRYADGDGECRVKHWKDDVDIVDLMEEMGLQDEVKEFYTRKIGDFGDDGILTEEDLWQEVLDEEDFESAEI